MGVKAKVYSVGGVSGSIKELCMHFKVSRATVYKRMKAGMSLEEAFITGVNSSKAVEEEYCIRGIRGSRRELCSSFGIPYEVVLGRVRNGMSLEEALVTPYTNTRRIIYSVGGISGTLRELCVYYGISINTYYKRRRKGMSIEEAFLHKKYTNSGKVSNKKPSSPVYVVGGISGTKEDLCRLYGVSPVSLRYRLRIGLSLEEALLGFND